MLQRTQIDELRVGFLKDSATRNLRDLPIVRTRILRLNTISTLLRLLLLLPPEPKPDTEINHQRYKSETQVQFRTDPPIWCLTSRVRCKGYKCAIKVRQNRSSGEENSANLWLVLEVARSPRAQQHSGDGADVVQVPTCHVRMFVVGTHDENDE